MGPEPSAEGLSDVEREVLNFLRGRRRGATANFIAVKVNRSPELVRLALRRLLLLDVIERRGKFFRAKRAAKASRAAGKGRLVRKRPTRASN